MPRCSLVVEFWVVWQAKPREAFELWLFLVLTLDQKLDDLHLDMQNVDSIHTFIHLSNLYRGSNMEQ